ncbi:hypothetical protein NW762_010330 [Fusarium torreyae]|uniref:Uncharacterized protein n=1 Tax=Fusarium torreyae TaxID=1237075 RepID=A0A9W8VAI8_9HYPO|nr:hypothetical protein NW762_010330 [Fusarium torreyae]
MEIATSELPVFVRQECPGKSMEQAIEILSERATFSFFASIPGLCENTRSEYDLHHSTRNDLDNSTLILL